jgi:hypothetical protein
MERKAEDKRKEMAMKGERNGNEMEGMRKKGKEKIKEKDIKQIGSKGKKLEGRWKKRNGQKRGRN